MTLSFNGKEEKLRLINNKIQVGAVKEAFNLSTVQLDGQLEPVDQLGFTVAEFKPGQTVMVSGSPTTGRLAVNSSNQHPALQYLGRGPYTHREQGNTRNRNSNPNILPP